MAVITNLDSNVSTAAKDLLWANPDAVAAIVRETIEGQVGAWIEMSLDDPADLTKEYVEERLAEWTRQSVKEYLADVMRELQQAVEKKVDNIKFTQRVTRLDYDDKGVVEDVTVKIKFE